MPIATVLTILNIVNTLFSVIKSAPGVQQEIQSLLEKVAPHVQAAGTDPQSSYIAAKQRLVNTMQPLLDPATGSEVVV
jgi:hypothetical protein